MINIEDSYILEETGAQVDKVTGLFTKDEDTTSGEKAFAQLNIGASGGGGRNLLDNGWFTIDQTEVTSGAATGGTSQDVRDRWRLARCSEYTFNNDGTVTSKWDGTGAGCYLIQYALLDNAAFYKGKTCTLSFYADGELYTRTITMPTGTTTSFTIGGVSVNVADRTSSDRGYECQFYHSVSAGKTLGPFKLEEGSVSTLANDGPPEHEAELAKCQRVFIRIKSSSAAFPVAFGVQYKSTAIRCAVPTPVEMRAQPTASFSGTHNVYGGGTASKQVSSYSVVDRNAIGICLIANISSGTFASSENYIVYIANGGYLDLSCRPS